MNKFPICLTLIVLFSLTLVSAQNSDRPEGFPGPSSDQSGGQIPPSIIEELTQPLQNAFQPLVDAAKYILGGIFGLYVFLVLIRIYYERKKVKLLKDICFDFILLKIKINVFLPK